MKKPARNMMYEYHTHVNKIFLLQLKVNKNGNIQRE